MPVYYALYQQDVYIEKYLSIKTIVGDLYKAYRLPRHNRIEKRYNISATYLSSIKFNNYEHEIFFF